jgi:hypothetical protein
VTAKKDFRCVNEYTILSGAYERFTVEVTGEKCRVFPRNEKNVSQKFDKKIFAKSIIGMATF